jgi:hypothetical protein
MNELRSVLRLARVVFVDRTQRFLPCLVLAGTLLCPPVTSSWATPGDHNGETAVVAPAAEPASDTALIGAIKDLASNSPALDQLIEFDATALQQLYAGRNYQPIWVTNAGLQPSGEALLSTLERLQRSGALPSSADVAAASSRRGGAATAALAEMELLLSSALIRTAVDPQDLLAPGPRPQVLAAAGCGRRLPHHCRERRLAERRRGTEAGAGRARRAHRPNPQAPDGGRRSRRRQRRIGCL